MKRILLTIIFIISIQTLFGQKEEVFIPATPNVASIGKYIETPAANYTGVPNIQIPIYEIKTNSLSVPITLSYHAQGIKVGEIASWAGLGWSLNCEMFVKRQVRGITDDIHPYGFMYYSVTPEEFIDLPFLGENTDLDQTTQLNRALTNTADFESDVYVLGGALEWID